MGEALKKKLIGVCLSTVNEEDRFSFIDALNECAKARGFCLMVFNSCTDLYERENLNNEGEMSVFRLIPYDMLSAMVVFPYFLYNEAVTEEVVSECFKRDIPVVSIDKPLEGCINFSFTYADSFEQICEHVVTVHGARKLLMLAGIKGNRFSDERIGAFRRTLERHGIEYSDDLVGYGDFWDMPSKLTLKRWFEEEKREIPDAIICANDSMALAVSNYLQSRGYHIPDDCIVTGFDGVEQSRMHIPALTTCRQDFDGMAEKIFEALEKRSRGEEVVNHTEIPFKPIISQSCGCRKISHDSVNITVQSLVERMRLANERQVMMCEMQTHISNMSSITDLPKLLIEKFSFPTIYLAVNEDIFRAPDFGTYHKGDKAFSDFCKLLFARCDRTDYEPRTVSRHSLVGDLTPLLEKGEPIIVSCMHFLDLVLGYCVFQPPITYDDYGKLHSFMNALDASLGIFHSQMQIKSINSRLVSVNNELERLYVHDSMTGLLNRQGFYRNFSAQVDEHLTAAVRDRNRVPVSVCFISADLDGLKYINDNFGHLEGDNAIVTVGHALLASAMNCEVCARFGGDEFTVAGVIPTDDTEKYFEGFVKRFKEYLSEYNRSSCKPYKVESSIGCYAEPLRGAVNSDHMIKFSDDLMYENKIQRKKNRA